MYPPQIVLMVSSTYSTIIFTYKGSHVWIQFYFHFPYFMSILLYFSLHTYLVFAGFCVQFWSMQLAHKEVKLRPNIFILQLYFEYKNPHFTIFCYRMFSLGMGSNFHTVHPCQPQRRLVLCTPH